MQKIKLIIAIAAIFSANIANAQESYDLTETWQKNINVPASQGSTIEKLFSAWGKEFPGKYIDAFNKFQKTGKADKIEYNGTPIDFNVDIAPKNGYIEIKGSHTITITEDGNYQKGDVITKEHILNAAYWNLPNGNKLLGISVKDDGEVFAECLLAFYEYNASNGTLTPRSDLSKKVMNVIENDHEIFIILPKKGLNLEYYEYASKTNKTIKWNGNGF